MSNKFAEQMGRRGAGARAGLLPPAFADETNEEKKTTKKQSQGDKPQFQSDKPKQSDNTPADLDSELILDEANPSGAITGGSDEPALPDPEPLVSPLVATSPTEPPPNPQESPGSQREPIKSNLPNNQPIATQPSTNYYRPAYRPEKFKKKRLIDTHDQKSYYIEKEIAQIIDELAGDDTGFKYRFVNEALRLMIHQEYPHLIHRLQPKPRPYY